MDPKLTPAVEAQDLGKAYRVYNSPYARIGEVLTLGRYKAHHEFWALRHLSMKLYPGGSFGLVGANGAGKSTLLKVLAGTTAPTEGAYRLNGRVASLLELGAGFHMEFTGRANVMMNGVMMGYSRREMEAKMEQVIDFAELGPYIDEPVRTYSSGMGLRLGFSVAVAVDPEILIIDEVFAVGDMYFQKKCVDKIYEFKKRNKTILFCSHSLYDVRQLCDEAVWIDHGDPRAIGDSVFVTNEYTAFQRAHIGQEKDLMAEYYPDSEAVASRKRQELPHILDARIYRMGTEEEVYEITTGDSIELRVWWKNPRPLETPVNIGMAFLRQDTTTCAGMGTNLDGIPVTGGGGCAVLRIPEVQLLSGSFLVPVLLLDEAGVHRYEEFSLQQNLVVRTNTRDVGMVRMKHSWEFTDLPLPTALASEQEATA
ncbi:MAG: polysaccharide ABC transporter ATP-binding protein [Planctomycetota bacterium]